MATLPPMEEERDSAADDMLVSVVVAFGGERDTDLVHKGAEIPTCVLPRDVHQTLTRHIKVSRERHPKVRHRVHGILNHEPTATDIDPRQAPQTNMDSNNRNNMLRPPTRQRDCPVPRRRPRRLLQREPRLLGRLRRRGGADPPRRVRRAAAAVLDAGGYEDAVAVVALAVAAVVEALAAEGLCVIALVRC